MDQTPPAIRYATTEDGFNIAYSVAGHGPPLVMLLPNPHLALTWALPSLRMFFQRLAAHVRVINLDLRGSGLSERHVVEVTSETFAADINSVLDKIGLSDVSLLGLGIACPIVLVYAAKHPARVRRMVLIEAALGDSDINRAIDSLPGLDRRLVAESRAAFVVGLDDAANASAYAALQRGTRDAAANDLFKGWLSTLDVSATCSQVNAPTLFIHAAGDSIFPLETARQMAAPMPNAMMQVFSGDSGFSIRKDEAAIQSIVEFLLSGSFSPSTGYSAVSESQGVDELSHREIEVLLLLAAGLTNKQIAGRLFVSASTVSHHVTSILTKTGAANRTEAAAISHRHGLVRPGSSEDTLPAK